MPSKTKSNSGSEYGSKLNIIPAIFRKFIFNTHVESNDNQSIKFIVILLLIAGFLALIHGSIKDNMLSSTSIVVIIITFFATYFYIRKQYAAKIRYLERRLRIMAHPTILDDICNSDSSNNTCIKYTDAKKDFFQISNLLLQQYNSTK